MDLSCIRNYQRHRGSVRYHTLFANILSRQTRQEVEAISSIKGELTL